MYLLISLSGLLLLLAGFAAVDQLLIAKDIKSLNNDLPKIRPRR
jgi:hypothetical protein